MAKRRSRFLEETRVLGLDPKRRICHLHQFYHCIVLRGTASVVRNDVLKIAALNTLIAKHENTNDAERVNKNMLGYKACKVIEVKPLSITAKSDLGQNRPGQERRAIAEYLSKRDLPGDQETAKAMGFNFK